MIIYIILIIIIIFLIFAKIYISAKENEYKTNEDTYWKSDKSTLASIFLEKINNLDFSQELNNLISYEIFKGMCINKVLDNTDFDELRNNLRINDDHKRPSVEKLMNYSSYVLNHNNQIDQKLVSLFINQVEKNVEEAEKFEKEQVDYIKTFGNDDDVQLRDAEKEAEDPDIPDSTIEELYKNNITEDLDNITI